MLVVADDLTGAADSAVGFAESGCRSRVDFDEVRAPAPAGGVVAVDTDTRHADPRTAASRVAGAVRRGPRARRYFKKIDSLLRGNPGTEIEAMLATAGRRLALCAPAFPAVGRVTIGGAQWAHGIRMAELHAVMAAQRPTSLGLSAIRSGNLTTLLADLLNTTRIAVADAVTDDDLARLVAAAAPLEAELLWAGSGGLGAALAAITPPATPAAPSPDPVRGAILVVVGSTAATAAAQASALVSEGFKEVVFPGQALLAGDRRTVRAAAQAAAAPLLAGEDVLATIGPPGQFFAGAGRRLVEALATALAEADVRPSALVATGGDTARCIVQALGATGINLACQVEPGIVAGRLADGPGWQIVTKSGTFGDNGSLVRAVRRMRSLEALTKPAGEETR